ncbi:MAG: type transport system permease protein [Trebonia sp.]|nr:type transport system permease protein [Trebonia sp.]
MTALLPQPVRPRRDSQRSAFGNLVRTEAKLLCREVVPLLWGVAFPMALLSIMGEFSHGPNAKLGGFSLVASYEPILIAFTCATFALQGLPTVLAGYRERGILRRLNATPVGAGRLLGAQLTVNIAVPLVSSLGIVIVGAAAFGVPLPSQPAGFVLALMLTAAVMVTLGLLVASVARTGRVAGAVGTMIFLPLMFFAGLWTPQATMPAALRSAGDDTPLGAAVSALQHSMAGQWPSASGLAILAGYTVVFGLLAWRLFRWD